MTDETNFEGKEAFRCQKCGMHYGDKSVAEECEKYCRENDACNSEITRKSIERS